MYAGDVVEAHLDERITAFGLLAEAYAGLVARFSTQLAQHGLLLTDFEVLVRIARSPQQRLRMTELATQVSLTSSGVTRVIDRLERNGLVRREACPEDRRGMWAAVTDEGMSRLDTALPGHLELISAHFTDRFTAEELAQLIVRLREIRDDVNPSAAPVATTAPAATAWSAPAA